MKLARIAYVANVFPKLSETFIANELAELRRRGIEVRVLSLRQPTDTLRHEVIAQAGLESVTCCDPARFPGLLREFKPQLLHAHFATEPAAAARQWAGQLGVPFTFTAHGYDIRRKAPPDFAERAAAASVVVTVSEANRQHIINTFGVPAEKLRVIPSGVDTEWFRPVAADVRRRKDAVGYGLPSVSAGVSHAEIHAGGTPVKTGETPAPLPALPPHGCGHHELPLLVCVARHVKVKNLGLLLQACALLRDSGVRFRCVSVGDGVCRAELEALRKELGLERIIEFVGAQTQGQVLAWWQSADLAVLTSDSEGMPVCLMEAAACALPVVATEVGGIPELVVHGETGLLTSAGDPRALAQALQELIEHPEPATIMGAAARDRVVARFSLTRQVDELLAVWSEVLR
jgi:glycosyltransferase involved in cell wall biosynthesis